MLKTFLLSLAENNSVFGYAKKQFQSVRDWIYYILPINKKLIVFESYRSSKYADSPREIYEFLLDNAQYDDYKFIWLLENPEDYDFLKNGRTKLVKHESVGYYIAFARAKYWVVNGWIPLRVQKKPGQVALQCWHGTPLKRLRYDIVDSGDTHHKENALRDNDEDMKRYDYLVSPSSYATEKFTSAFNLRGIGKEAIVVETGYPRNDVLVNSSKANRQKLREKYTIPKDKKVLLYAPTWRDDQRAQSGGYQYTLPVDFDYLKQKLGEDWVILFRAHNLVANTFDFAKYKNFIYDVSSADDIGELYLVADALMTDYSSVFFDFAVTGLPVLFYMYDLDHYQKNLRGFYIDIETLPGEIIKKESGVVSALGDLKAYEKRFSKKYKTFRDTYNYLEDGNATKRVVDIVFKTK